MKGDDVYPLYTFRIKYISINISTISQKNYVNIFLCREQNNCQDKIKVFWENMHYGGFVSLESMYEQ